MTGIRRPFTSTRKSSGTSPRTGSPLPSTTRTTMVFNETVIASSNDSGGGSSIAAPTRAARRRNAPSRTPEPWLRMAGQSNRGPPRRRRGPAPGNATLIPRAAIAVQATVAAFVMAAIAPIGLSYSVVLSSVCNWPPRKAPPPGPLGKARSGKSSSWIPRRFAAPRRFWAPPPSAKPSKRRSIWSPFGASSSTGRKRSASSGSTRSARFCRVRKYALDSNCYIDAS